MDPALLRGAAQGRQAFVVANGPSVLEHSLQHLSGHLAIGMNATPLLEAQYGFSSQYYCVSDERFMAHPEKRWMATAALGAHTVRVLRSELNVMDDTELYPRTCYVPTLGRDGFSADLAKGFYFGCSTTMLAVQLAFHLGCRLIALLGCDFRYPPDAPRFYPEMNPCPEDPMISVQVRNMANARIFLHSRGVELVNCSPVSALRPYVPFVSFDALLMGV